MLPLIGAGVGLASGGLSFLGGLSQNRANKQIAREQMQFQERMRNTAYQSAVKDMQLAGLNPALAYQQGGAATPSGASAQMENAAAPLAAGLTSAGQAAMMAEQVRLQGAQADKTAAEARYVDALSMAQVSQMRAQLRLTGMNTAQAVQNLRYGDDSYNTRLHILNSEKRSAFQNAENLEKRSPDLVEQERFRTKGMGQDIDLRNLERNELEAMSKFWGGTGGTIAPWLERGGVLKALPGIGRIIDAMTKPKKTTHVWKR